MNKTLKTILCIVLALCAIILVYKIYDGTIKPVRCYTMLREEYDGLRHAGVL